VATTRATLVHGRNDVNASDYSRCFRGALPPVDFRAVCLVRAIVKDELDLVESCE
jgi:hypothetical protein